MSLTGRLQGRIGFKSNWRKYNQAKYGQRGKDRMIEMVGDKELVKVLDLLKLSSVKKIMRPAISQALTIANREAKSLAPKRTGQLRRAIGKRIKTKKQAVIGWLTVRQGFQHTQGGRMVDPNRYAWPVEFGEGGKRSFLRKAMSNKRAMINAKISNVAGVKLELEANKARIKGRAL